ncbi:MAG TPA: OsmC family protein [Candidatus Kapabacteria bacterium]|nr:OsmC family protein [Candidatus Kapabacteria bacterium]
MVNIIVDYLDNLNCKVTHEPSGTYFLTDAPLDNNGKAEYISPTDLAAASIGSCIATIMGIKANANNINLSGLKIIVSKEMINEPFRRINKLTVNVYFKNSYNDKEKAILENVIKTCPVSRSLLPEIEIISNVHYIE